MEKSEPNYVTLVRRSIPPAVKRQYRTVLRITDRFRAAIFFQSPELRIIRRHFARHASLRHVNLRGFETAIIASAKRGLLIIETGSSAWGVNSTSLWSSWVSRMGGGVITVDVRSQPSELLRDRLTNVDFRVGDSVQVLSQLPDSMKSSPKLIYLDSMDLAFENPWPSMEHGIAEFRALERLLIPGDIILIDDTPKDLKLLGANASRASEFLDANSFIPGKGALILRESQIMSRVQVLYHDYNLVLKVL